MGRWMRGDSTERKLLGRSRSLRCLLGRVCETSLRPAVTHETEASAAGRPLRRTVKQPALPVAEALEETVDVRAVESDPDAPIQTTARTNIGQLIGTVSSMSPERITPASADLDTRTDVYSLGVVAYQLLTGQIPLDVRSRSVPEATRVIREDEPRPTSSFNRSFRGEVETMVARAPDEGA